MRPSLVGLCAIVLVLACTAAGVVCPVLLLRKLGIVQHAMSSVLLIEDKACDWRAVIRRKRSSHDVDACAVTGCTHESVLFTGGGGMYELQIILP